MSLGWAVTLRTLLLGANERMDTVSLRGQQLECATHGGGMGVLLSPGRLGRGQCDEVVVKDMFA